MCEIIYTDKFMGKRMKDYIPYELRSIANQIDPQLDLYWIESAQNLFNNINDEYKNLIQNQIFQKKSIFWDKANNTFKLNKKYNFQNYIETITHIGIKNLAEKILVSSSLLEKYTDALEIANFIEGLISQVNKIDTEENINLQKYKNEIKIHFIYHLAHIIKNKNNITLSKGLRQIDSDVIKAFINEVYLKQQLLGYLFKTTPIRELKKQSNPLFSEYLIEQKQLRQLEIIRTSKYFFCLSQPSNSQQINTYSIRRFLNEEKSAVSDIVYLYSLPLDLSRLQDQQYISTFKQHMNRIVTVEKQIGNDASNFIAHLQEHNNNILLPLLMSPLDSTGLNMDKVVEDRLVDFEKLLILDILEHITIFQKSKVTHQDECDFIYMSIREIFSDIVNYFQDFQQQPAVIFNDKAKLFSYRLIAWINLLQKRNLDIFTRQTSGEWNSKHEKMYQSIQDLEEITKTSLHKYKKIYKEIKEIEKDIASSNGLFNRIMKTKEKKEEKLSIKLKDLNQIKVDAFLDIIRIPKKYPDLTVYLEYEATISIDSKERHYAFSIGDNGLSRLPIMIKLPEDRSKFNLNELKNNLDFDIKAANQKWI